MAVYWLILFYRSIPTSPPALCPETSMDSTNRLLSLLASSVVISGWLHALTTVTAATKCALCIQLSVSGFFGSLTEPPQFRQPYL
ncbi:uncharacterized protein [Equus caballus]|uniref:uncharacterized protein n=1 Tax=Equus caballus TaxID=9796 RepID=UPI0038B366BE